MHESTTPSAEPAPSTTSPEYVIRAVNAATEAALEDGPALHPAARRDAVLCLYLRAIGLGLAAIASELEALRDRP